MARARSFCVCLFLLFYTLGKARKPFNGPFAANGHMVQNPPCWGASYALGHPKQRDYIQSHLNFLCFGSGPNVQLELSSKVDFVSCHR